MATFKGIVRPYRRADGTYHIYIRVTHKRVYRDMATPFFVTSEQITRGFKIKDQAIIDKLEDKIREYRNNANNLGFLIDGLDVDHLVELLHNQSDKIDFFEFWEDYISSLKRENRGATVQIYESALRNLRRFNNEQPLYFSAITQSFVQKYYESMQDIKPNTKIMYMGKFKTVYKKAQLRYNNNDAGIVIVRHGVFDNLILPQRESSKENVIRNIEDMQKLIDEPYPWEWGYEFAKDMFILSFTCFGTNIADFLQMKPNQYKDGILYYRRKKTGRMSGTDVDMQVKVPEVAQIILNKYSNDPDWLISFNGRTRNDRFTRFIHYYFAKIGLEEMPKNLNSIGVHRTGYTFYASRHTMASMARNICKVEYMTVHEMLNHAKPSSLKNTDTYLYKDYTAIWDANEKLLSLFDWSFYLKQKNSTYPSRAGAATLLS